MRVLLAPRHPDKASSRVRLGQYGPALRAAGVEVRTLPWVPRSRRDVAAYGARLLAGARWADVVVLQKPAQPPALLRAVRRVNPALVVDVDDAAWLPGVGGDAEGAGVAGGTHPARVAAALRLARLVVAGSEHLAGEAAGLGLAAPPVVIRPSVVAADWAGAAEAAAARSGPVDGGPPVLGWLGGPGNLRDFGPEVRAGLAALVAGGEARVRLVTSGAPDWPEGPDLPVEVVPWRLADEPAAVGAFDVGLMPLRDDARSRGRCGYKAIQCLAVGVPVVATAVGAGPEVVGHDERGRLVPPGGDWEAPLRALVAEADTRRSLGAAGRAWVASEATVEATVDRWLAVLDRAAGHLA